nr:hypothetical protein [Tanacetum cinerariifolium]
MGDANPIRTLRDYSKPSHEGYRNNIELPIRNTVVPLRSDTIWAPEKVLIRKEAKSAVTKNVNSMSLTKGEEERNNDNDISTGKDIEKPTRIKIGMPVNKAKKGIKNKPIRKAKKEKTTEAPSSQPIEYYLKHRINEKLIERLVGNHMFNDSLSRARVRKIKERTYNLLPRGPVYGATLRKKDNKEGGH